jgi:hypothetical protein
MSGTDPDLEGTAQPEPKGEERFEGPLRLLVSIGANVTVITALLIFFGLKRAEAHATALGVDQSIFGMSTRDYLFRSVDSLFPLLAFVALAGIGWLWLYGVVARALREERRWRLLGVFARMLGFAWLAIPVLAAAFSFLFPDVGFLVFPLSFAVGTLLTWYGVYLRGELSEATGQPQVPMPAWHTALIKTFVALVVTLSLFWEVANYATVIGDNLGRRFEDDLQYKSQVVVYSSKRMAITAPYVREDQLPGTESAYRWRYTGLRFLEHIGNKHFLVSDGWTPQYGVVVVLTETDSVRLEFVRDLRAIARRPRAQ